MTGTDAPRAIRREILARRDALEPGVRARLSRRIWDHLESLEPYRRCRCPLLYVSFRSEVETHGLIRNRLGRRLEVAVPLTDVAARRLVPFLIQDFEADLAPGAYGILEPRPGTRRIDPGEIDLVVVPGSVFDKRCGRFGYGGGYYDRFLSQDAPRALRIALAFGMQVRERLPLQPHDERMDMVVTEEGVYRCPQQ